MNSKIMEKINKLMALSSSPEEGEASTAMEMAIRLMEENNISYADLDASKLEDELGPIGEETYDKFITKSPSSWEKLLGKVIAHHFDCLYVTKSKYREELYHGKPCKIYSPNFIGHEGNRRTAMAMWQWLRKKILEEAKTTCPYDQKGFCSGVVMKLEEKYPFDKKEMDSTSSDSTELVVVNKVQEWADLNLNIKSGKALSIGGSSIAMAKGKEMGEGLSLNRQFGLKAISA